MNPLNLPAGLATLQQQPAEPFQWGSGGRRMTPDQIAREREIANAMMAVDYSPVASPWQGLARVSENIRGALGQRRADKAEQANMDYSDEILQSLMNPGGVPSASGAPGVASPAPGANLDQLSAILGDPYVTPQAKAVAQQRLDVEMKRQAANLKSQFDTWDDNAGNRWRLGTNGMPEMIFHDRNAKRIPQKVFDADGNEYIEYVEIPNAYGPDGKPLAAQPQAAAPIADLPEGYTVRGAPGVESVPPIANVMQRDEYQMFVRSMGKEAADSYLASQGITVAGGR